MYSGSSGAFVGRRPELATLEAMLEDARAGYGRTVLLAGEAGIGKTSTADELARRARQLGFGVLVGRCDEEAGAPAYWPWLQIIHAEVSERPPSALRTVLRAGAPDVVSLLPELGTQLAELPASPPLEPAQARFRLFDAVSAFIKRASQERPLLLVRDDLHWAGASSLLLLRFLVRELGDAAVVLLGTYRDDEVGVGHVLADVLGEIVRHGHVSTLALVGLGDVDVAQLVEVAAALAAPVGLWRDEAPVADLFGMMPHELVPYLFHDQSCPAAQAMHAVTNLFSEKDDRTQDQVEFLISLVRGFRTAAKFLFPIPEHGLEKRLSRIKAPTLVVWGTEDRLVPPLYARVFGEKIAGPRVHMIENAGHLVGLERPAPYAEAVVRFGHGG